MQQYTLKELRARKNMTQAEVADKIGVSMQTYNAWEKDVSNVSIGKVSVLADFFGVTIGEIFLTKDMKNIHNKNRLGVESERRRSEKVV